MATGVELIAFERKRQVDVERWDDDHDDLHVNDEIAIAAACYAMPDRLRAVAAVRSRWPWSSQHWKPTPDDRVRELIKAGALIAAEIDRLQRPAASASIIKRQAEKIEVLRRAIAKTVAKASSHCRDDHQCDLCDALEATRI